MFTYVVEQSIEITITYEALAPLIDIGFDPNYGTRRLKRFIQQELHRVSWNVVEANVSTGGLCCYVRVRMGLWLLEINIWKKWLLLLPLWVVGGEGREETCW